MNWPITIALTMSRWVWAARWRRVALRAVALWHLIGALAWLVTGVASADPGSGSDDPTGVGRVFGWTELKDSHGIPADQFTLSLDRGGPTNPWNMLWAWTITIEYEIYRGIMLIAIWFIGWVLSFDWLDPLLAPAQKIADAVTSLTGQLALGPLMFTIAGFCVALWIFRGRMATALYEALSACMIFALGVVLLANPVATVAGTDGLIPQARDTGLQVAAGLTNNGDTSSDPHRQIDIIRSAMVDTFIRKPTQLVNFGQVLDDPDGPGGHCVKEFDDAYLTKHDPSLSERVGDALDNAEGPLGTIPGVSNVPGSSILADQVAPGSAKPADRVRKDVGKCDKALQKYAENPGPEQAMAISFLLPAALLVTLFAMFLAGRALIATVSVLVNAIKLIPGVVLAVAPVMRGQLLRTVADTAMCLVQLVFSVVYVVAYANVVAAVFTGPTLMAAALFADVLLVAGLIVYWRGIRGLQRWSERLAAAMAVRPNASPVAIPQRNPAAFTELAAKANLARGTIHGGAALARGAGTAAKTTGKVVAGAGKLVGHAATGGTTAVLTGAAAAGRLAIAGAKAGKAKLDSIAEPTPGSNSTPESVPAERTEQLRDKRGRFVGGAQAAAEHGDRLRGRLTDKTNIPIQLASRVTNLSATRGLSASRDFMMLDAEKMRHDGRNWQKLADSSGNDVWLPAGPAPGRRERPVPVSSPASSMPRSAGSGPDVAEGIRARLEAAKPAGPEPTRIE